MKLVFFDFPLGRPHTLFAAMALYGVALIVAPRLWRGTGEPALRRGAHGTQNAELRTQRRRTSQAQQRDTVTSF